MVWGGVRPWQSLIELDLMDEWYVSMYPYIAGKGTRPFGDVPSSYAVDLVSSVAKSNGVLKLHYRRNPG